ncbi:hypothetical protein [Dactylosporangium sp. CA-233914]|uniref:hypothetical protein n=1 Tax=Dactylosporangium sp. CA-233914 TaxID=3239934 RepID=UPI003D901C53
MIAAGLTHFDAYVGNLRTDGRRVYLTDLGLAMHRRFATTAAEIAFLDAHEGYDHRLAAGHLAT